MLCLSPPLLARTNSWLATRRSIVAQYAFSFLPGRENRSLQPCQRSRQQERGERTSWDRCSPPPPTHPALSPHLLSGRTPHPAQGSRPGICLQQASELQAFALGRCLLGDPTCGHELRQEAFVSSHLLPSGAHSILKWQLKEGPWWADTGYYECPLAPCPHSNPSFLDRCDFRWPFLQVAQTCFSLHCPRQTKRRGLASMLIPQSRRKESPLGKSSVSRGKGAQASPHPRPQAFAPKRRLRQNHLEGRNPSGIGEQKTGN